ncbi:unnamed protein product [Cercopithifilaria johnstoni]|uniref:BPTI/Kunitz inhibitor domain-containing protein n=1 Tax=Cercopithifilaria johnstoni TaxID=2874296 RepID=A0A8J2LW31_9BILA|nr:unnamed protein product [Cercopithifilaria johnstoni]
MDTTYALLLIIFFPTSNKLAISTSNTIIKLVATLSNVKSHPCQQPLQRGNCSQRIPLFYYSNRDHECRRFIYSGCNGNENRFLSRRQCHAKCSRKLKFHVKQPSSTICNQRFDPLCRQTTLTARAWIIRYFYDIDENRCRSFWYGNCNGSEKNQNIFASEQECKLQCVRKKQHKLKKKPKNGILRKKCFLKFNKNLYSGCKTFDWRPRFFYNQTSSKCEMFWYDASCSKTLKVTNIFYHRGACKRLCEQTEQTTRPQQTGTRRIGQISAMFSQSYNSMRSNGHRKLIRMKNIFDANSNPTSDLSRIRVIQTYVNNAPANDNISNFDFHILSADPPRSLRKVYPRAVKKDDDVAMYHFNQFVPILSETSECGEFDSKLADTSITLIILLFRIFSSELRNNMEMNCLLPLDGGERFEGKECAEKAGMRYYYNQKNERCERFWYSGCAGNENRFYDLPTCETVCQHIPMNNE